MAIGLMFFGNCFVDSTVLDDEKIFDMMMFMCYFTKLMLYCLLNKQGKECTKSSEQGIHIDCDEFVILGPI